MIIFSYELLYGKSFFKGIFNMDLRFDYLIKRKKNSFFYLIFKEHMQKK